MLHWLIALALAGEIALGFAMPKDASGFTLYQLHKSIGITILVLSLARLGWRLTHKPPAPLEGGWEGKLASLQAEASGRFEPTRIFLRSLFEKAR